MKKGFWSIFYHTLVRLATKPVYWVGFFMLPLFLFFFLGNLMSAGLPERVPAAIVDLDNTTLSRRMTQNLAGMQMVNITEAAEDYTAARRLMQEGKVFGYFMIPRNFARDFKSGRNPQITFYTNETYFVPAAMLFKVFKASATYQKAGMLIDVAQDLGAPAEALTGMLNPVSVVTRPISNPWLNYAYYLGVSFMPGCLQLMIMLLTCFSLGENIKFGRSQALLQAGGGSIIKTVTGILAPQTIIWWVTAIFLDSWMYGWNHYPMHGQWSWIILSTLLFVLASQGFALLIFGAVPNLRMSVSVSALLGILTFSIAAFSFPVDSMYPAMGIFSWIVPVRYNFLIHIDQAINGIDIYYSRWWFVAYFIFITAPLLLMWRIRKAYAHPVYVP